MLNNKKNMNKREGRRNCTFIISKWTSLSYLIIGSLVDEITTQVYFKNIMMFILIKKLYSIIYKYFILELV